MQTHTKFVTALLKLTNAPIDSKTNSINSDLQVAPKHCSCDCQHDMMNYYQHEKL